MTATQATTMTLPLDQLRIDEKANVRKIGRGAEKDFIASIKAIGIQMPLIVRKNGKGYVVADGGKRLEAAQALVKSGDLKADAPIPVIVSDVSDAEARELSLALNLIRVDMHPVDAYRAFASLHTDKEKPLDVTAIASRFGIDAKTVRQRLALGDLDDTILAAWLKGDLREEDVKAFTLQPDKKAQVAIFTKLKKSRNCYSHAIRAAIREGQENASPMLAFVTQKAYEAKGGRVTQDLFGSEHTVSDFALLQSMTDAKLAETAEKLKADGWAWVMVGKPEQSYEYGTVQPEFHPTSDEKKKIKALEKKIDADDDSEAYDELQTLNDQIEARGFTAKIKATAGCFITLGREGVAIESGRIAPKDKKEAAGANGKSATASGKPAKKGPATLTQAMRDRLNEWRRTALKNALAQHPHGNPLALMLAGIVVSQIHPESRFNWAPDAISKKGDDLANLIAPKIMNAALRKTFDAKGYFEGCGKAFCLAAITEAVNSDEARKVQGQKRGEIAKFALVNVGKTGWLPKEMRTSHYDGPQGKASAKSKSKKAAR